MRWTRRLVEATSEALGRTLDFEYPADAVLSQYFRENPNLGHAERGMVAEATYGVLRRLRTLEAACEGNRGRRELLLAWLFCIGGLNLREFEPILDKEEAEWLGGVKGRFSKPADPAVAADLPDWLWDQFVAQWGEDEAKQCAAALNRPAPLDLRVNTLKADRDAVLPMLTAAGMPGKPTALSPFGIRLEGKPALSKLPMFIDGSIEVQDEGSQLLGLLLAPKRGEMVVDFCAGAGGKTLLLGALMRSTGRLYAFDVAEKRLANLKPRLARSGLSNVHPVRIEHERDTRVKRLAGKIDRVLVDAPCSGLGTLRRNPDLKWRQNPEAIGRLVLAQRSILEAAASLLKPGGRIVYATCSPLADENDNVIDGFLAEHPAFVEKDAQEILAAQGVVVDTGKRLRLMPHRHGTDGFFAAVLERT
jgi:16S rRNA (cytosine967-C5)-methyltransferase